MRDWIERTVSPVLAIAAVAIAGSVVHREFVRPPVRAVAPALGPPVFVAAWKDALQVGVEVGDRTAPVKIVEFSDLECPFCRGFHAIARDVMKEHPKDASLVFVHYPLASHRFAMQAARAVECASARGHFSELVELLFSRQDSLGMKSWGSYAQDVGLTDTTAFKKCVMDQAPVRRIEDGRALGEKIQITGTPTVLVNGWRYSRPPNKDELAQAVRAIVAGGTPVDGSKTASRE